MPEELNQFWEELLPNWVEAPSPSEEALTPEQWLAYQRGRQEERDHIRGVITRLLDEFEDRGTHIQGGPFLRYILRVLDTT